MVSRATPSLLYGATMQHFPEIQLTLQEARVPGCLLDKEILTPDNYPLRAAIEVRLASLESEIAELKAGQTF